VLAANLGSLFRGFKKHVLNAQLRTHRNKIDQTMGLCNSITGLKRRRDRKNTTRKKRESLASTCDVYLSSVMMCLRHASAFCSASPQKFMPLTRFLLIQSALAMRKSLRMITLDSQLMDYTPEQEAVVGYSSK